MIFLHTDITVQTFLKYYTMGYKLISQQEHVLKLFMDKLSMQVFS